MKKVIFEGTVDGVKFDNVKEYNKAVTKALAEGRNVQASSNTKVVDTADEVEVNDDPKDCNCEHCNCRQELSLPGFTFNTEKGLYEDSLYDDFARFLDVENFNSDGRAFEDKLGLMVDIMSKILEDVDKHPELLEQYAKLLTDVNDILNQDAKDTKEAIDDAIDEIQDLQHELEEAKHELTIQKRYGEILTMYHNFYKELEIRMNHDNVTPKTEVRVAQEPKEVEFRSDKELEPILKLFSEIFSE